VKLSAEVCDLSEDMRTAMDKGASQIIALLGEALEKGRLEGRIQRVLIVGQQSVAVVAFAMVKVINQALQIAGVVNQHTLNQFCQQGIISGCLTVKLSAEVCDLSEDMPSPWSK
jgi:hypothetical protein